MSTDESTKSKARAISDQLPDSVNWDDVMYELYLREAIDAGLADVAAGRSITTAQVRARLVDRFLARAEQLADVPLLGSPSRRAQGQGIRERIEGEYVIVDLPQATRIDILAVVSVRQDLTRRNR